MTTTLFDGMTSLGGGLRQKLTTKKFVLLYAHNGTGKTRLSTVFKDLGKQVDEEGETIQQDTLYFNAFTEDLFSWDNDLDNNVERVLEINSDSRFFAGLENMEMDNRIRPLLSRYADFDFRIDTIEWKIYFSRQITYGDGEDARSEIIDNIKISRGEENIFIWCFFLAIVQLALDGAEAYKWVEYIYIDDPISSLDENNAISVANHLSQMLLAQDNGPKAVISTHHALFFNVLCNEIRNKAHRHLLCKGVVSGSYDLKDSTSKPFLHHLASLVELDKAQKSGELYTHHFNMLRRVMEQTANFFGADSWTNFLVVEEDNLEKPLYKRLIDLMSHGDYSLFEPVVMMDENKNHFRNIFLQFIQQHPFEPALFPDEPDPSPEELEAS